MRRLLPLLLCACGGDAPSTTKLGDPGCMPRSTAIATWDGGTLSLSDPACGTVSLSARVLAEGDATVSFEAVEGGWQPTLTSSTGAVVDGLVLEGTYTLTGEAEAVMWRQGYQSWSWSGVTSLVAPNLDTDGLAIPGGTGDQSMNYVKHDRH